MSGFVFFAHEPAPALAPFVETLWGVRGVAHFHVESVLPNGATELMVNLGPPQHVVAYGERQADDMYARAWLAGIQDQRLVHASPSGADHVAVRFRPGGAHAFFDLPMDVLTDQVVELSDLLGLPAAEALWARVREGGSDEARCRALEAWLLERRRAVHPYFATVRRAIDILRGRSWGTPVAEACQRLGLSHRHLVTQFRRTVGLTPKVYARVERFQGVIDACRGRDEVPWSRVAARFGYADQSHLIREFRRLAMVTPEAFLERRTPDGSAVIVQ